MTIFIIRHGQTSWNAEYRLQGQRDIPLNDLGRQQATRNGKTLKSIAGDLDSYAFVSSPLSRARETMERVRAAAGLDPKDFSIDDRLIEICFGDWEGRTIPEIAADTPDKIRERKSDKWNFVPPGARAESYEILTTRVNAWFSQISRPTVAVCHGGIIRCIFKLTGVLDSRAAARLDIPQDRILRWDGSTLDWI